MTPGDDDLDWERLELVADGETAAGERLDQFIVRSMSQFSRARVQKLIDCDMIQVDGKAGKAGLKLKGGERITVTLPPLEELDLKPEAIPLTIVYQDQFLAVIDKPAGMVTHPGAGVFTGTLVNALLYHMHGSLSGIQGVARPGIVHRLDKDTSGLLVIAKDDQTHRHLAEQIKKKEARRTYMALVEGSLKDDVTTVSKNIGRHPHKRKQMAVVAQGKSAVSRITVMSRWHNYTLARVELETGRTHQIRVHMASIGCPVVGDLVYNFKSTGSESARHKLGLKGHALHAFQLSFVHPATSQLLEFEAPLPDDFQQLVTKLSGQCGPSPTG
jgi:23S rRNA pseudouridine1911/1915/1917 synthase